MITKPIIFTCAALVIVLIAAAVGVWVLAVTFTEAKYAREAREQSVDYTQSDNWLALGAAEKEADAFFLYPTCFSDGSGDWCAVDNAGMRTEAQKIRDAHAGIFDAANFFAPYYRQLSIGFIRKATISGTQSRAIAAVPLFDAWSAFTYYLDNLNADRPIILASHSQGTMVMKELILKIRRERPDVLARIIGAYLIGFSVNNNYARKAGLPFAERADDTGVIISYNTESPEAGYSPFLILEFGTTAINPVNWKRDDAYAPKEESLGSRIRAPDGGSPVDYPQFADARLNLKRGTVVTNAPITVDAYWPRGVLHRYDYDLFYYDLQHNVRTRIAAYFSR